MIFTDWAWMTSLCDHPSFKFITRNWKRNVLLYSLPRLEKIFFTMYFSFYNLLILSSIKVSKSECIHVLIPKLNSISYQSCSKWMKYFIVFFLIIVYFFVPMIYITFPNQVWLPKALWMLSTIYSGKIKLYISNTLLLCVILLSNSNSFLTGKCIASSPFRIAIWTLERNKSLKAIRMLAHYLTSNEKGRTANQLSSIYLDYWHCV